MDKIYYLSDRLLILNDYLSNLESIKIDENINYVLNNIKITNTSDNYNNYISDLIKDGSFKYICNINNEIKIFKYINNTIFFISCFFYNTVDDVLDIKNTPNNRIYITIVIADAMLKNKLKYILFPYLNIDINFDTIKHIIPTELIKHYEKCINKKKIIPILNCQILEYNSNIISSKEFFNNNYDIKLYIFQIMHALYIIQKTYPRFMHNSLNFCNIYIDYTKTNIQIDTINIKNSEFLIKITGFDKSCLDNKQYDSYFDIYTIFDIIIKQKKELDENLSNFLNKYYNNGKYITNKYNVCDVLKDEFFSNYFYNPKKHTRYINRTSDVIRKLSYYNIKKKMVGGAYMNNNNKIEKNDPFISNEQKQIKELNKETIAPIQQKKIIENIIYDTKPDKQPLTIPSYIPLNPYNTFPESIPQHKIYNVSLTNPLGTYNTMNQIYEDQLPFKSGIKNYTYTSIYERLELINFIRNIMINVRDGEDLTAKNGINSFLSYIKLLSLNPYTLDHPYNDLSKNFLIYKGAYPIKLDEKTHSVKISNTSTGVNVRFYMMSIGDINSRNIQNINSENFDLWRELKYYNWVKTTILKRKISPNFIAPILYKVDTDSKINWEAIEKNKSQYGYLENNKLLRLNDKKINNKHDMTDFYDLITNNKKSDITVDSKSVLILMTEAPTYSMLQWMTPQYSSNGSIKKMYYTGHHSSEVWRSILFQLVYAISVLYEEGVYMENFTLKDNIYIKDISYDANSIGSWIYKIDNIEYYVPNYGFVLVIDSKYRDVEIDDTVASTEKKYKMLCPMFSDNNKLTKDDIQKKIINKLKEIINYHDFEYLLKMNKNKGAVPPDDIIALLKNISELDPTLHPKLILYDNFKSFMHNRIGSVLYKTELDNITNQLSNRPKINKCIGKLLIYEQRHREYYWVLCIKEIDQFMVEIIIKNDNIYSTKEVHNGSLIEYPNGHTILPETKNNLNYDELYIYETYVFNNISNS